MKVTKPPEPCKNCNGKGYHGSKSATCKACKGSGKAK